jgi:phage gp46-like protein
MSDLKLTWDDTTGTADFSIVGDDIATDDTLETSAFLSLFLGSVKGWWGDAIPEAPGDRVGSRLYELEREKDLPQVLERAPKLVEEALAWMVEDQVASSVSATAESLPYGDDRSVLALTATINRPTLVPAVYRYAYNWQAQELSRAV